MFAILKQMRIHQWAKNTLVFLPLIAAHRVSNVSDRTFAIISFFAFSFCASAVYMMNDWVDLESDRNHPRKKNRPLVSGKIRTFTLIILILLCLSASFGLSLMLPRSFLIVLLSYLIATVLYSLYLKKIALVDVLLLSSLYTLRIFAGSEATAIPVSEWLLAFSMFFFLSLALAKRFTELKTLSEKELVKASRRGYSKLDLDYIPIMGISSGFLTSLVMALYVSGEHVRSLYTHPIYLWFSCPILLYWIGRVWLLCHRGKMEEDPVLFALKDPVSYFVLALLVLTMVAAT